MKLLLNITHIVCVLLVASSVYATEKIAVLDFKSLLAPEDLGIAVAEILRTELAGLGGYTIIERGMLEQLLNEQALQLSGAVDSETAVKIGMLAGAKIVVTGSIVKTGEMYTINSRFIEVETGIVKTGKNIRGQGEDQISNMVHQLALIITGKPVVTETPVALSETPAVPSSGKDTGEPQDKNPAGFPAGFPREIVEACQNKREQAACRIDDHGQTFQATCHKIHNQLACLLSREEASETLKQKWDRLDGNRDGFLDFHEMRKKEPQQDDSPRNTPREGTKRPSDKKQP